MIRAAVPDDAPACAAILNAWIDATLWMPRVHPPEDVVRYYREVVLPTRRIWVWGERPRGYLALDAAEGCVTALYVAVDARDSGVGRALLDAAKAECAALWLWTFEANTAAQRFYEANGFRPSDRTDGDNEEGLPDIRYAWTAP
ncbi:MAG: GNAT family N-acetyltransferase [Pseudomonadota bacterium]